MTAETDTVNAAMAHLGEKGFTSLDIEPAPAALTKALAQLRGKAGVEIWMLGRQPWLCAMTYATLSPADRAGNWKWAYSFDLPASFVKLWNCSADAYEVGSVVEAEGAIKRVIWANVASLDVGYTEKKGFEAYTTDLLHAMGLYLAARCAGPIQEDYKKSANLTAAADKALGLASGGEAGQHFGADDPPFTSGAQAARDQGAF